MKKIIIILLSVISINAKATEGMWIPSLIDMFYSDMQTYGLKLSQIRFIQLIALR